MANNTSQLIGELAAKINDLHEDVKELKSKVEVLESDLIKRATISKVSTWFFSTLIAVGSLIANILFNLHKGH